MSQRRIARVAVGVAASALVLALTACSGGASGKPADSTAADSASYGLVKQGILTVATEGTYSPFTFHADGGAGDLVGYDVEVAQAVGKELGLKVQFQETQWDGIFAGLEAGRFDVIANQVSINPERQAKYLFSTPYTVSPSVVVVKKGDTSIKTFADLKGKTTAQSLTSNFYKLAQDAGANVESVEGWAQAVALLEQGRVQATVNDKLTYLDYVKQHPDAKLAVAAQTDPTQSAFAFTKKKDALVKAVDKALAKLSADGTLAKLGKKYFGEDVSK
ncbi:transporter substrate-binding domain-containing protein [Microbacterium sp. 22242]|uniref:transporter substrate-binding domain-containing protein n=1 Tax=Microbacterium sp. 22242 TaxID=3453896 RepID=UPI003F854411